MREWKCASAVQDSPRGAFSQRHFLLFDQNSGASFNPFGALRANQARCDIIGSPLSEYSVLGFEYGYSMDAAKSLVVWEAQFGDFANVAQVIIDQFVVSGEDKWAQNSAVTLMLPHGLEGQGPDHSSGRIERFLQMCAGDNITVANCSTPANLFHLLRRQARHPARRPLVVFTPKSLLRHKRAVSRISDFATGSRFQSVISPVAAAAKVERVILCSGKIYYDLLAAAESAARRWPSSASSNSSHFRARRWRKLSPAIPTPKCFGARRSRQIWAHGPSSTAR